MSDDAVILLSAIFLAAIPLNLYVAREVRRIANVPPAIATLDLLSTLVDVLAIVACVIGIVAFVSVVFLVTAVRLIPQGGTTVALIAVLLIVSLANVLVLQYLRRMRNTSGSES